MRRGVSPAWLSVAVAVSAALVLGAPGLGYLRAVLREAAGDRFPAVMATLVGTAVLAALVFAVFRIRTRRRARYGVLAAAVLVAVGYAALTSSGVADVDAVERFHFVAYGLIVVLFWKAWRPVGDGSVILMPVLAGLIVGTCEEWLQWFVPARVGEVRDIGLNLLPITAGVLFCLALDPPDRLTWPLQPSSRRAAAVLAAAALVIFGAFFHSAHLGHVVADSHAGVFRSRYTADELAVLSEARREQWERHPPQTWTRFSREDQYLSEGLAHVARRNRAWEEGNLLAARHENLILERYYAPVLDVPTYASPVPQRWPDAQRAEAEAQGGPGFMIYDSDALPYPVFAWSRWLFWGIIGLAVALLLRVALG